MTGRADRAIRAAAVGAGLLALLVLVALASGRGRADVRGATDLAAVADMRDVVLTVGAVFYVLALGLAVWALWGHRGSGQKFDRPRFSFVGFLILSGLLFWAMQNRPEREALQPGGDAAIPRVEPRPEDPVPQPEKAIRPAEFRWKLAAGLLGGIGLAAALAVAARRRRAGGDLPPVGRRELAAAEFAAIVEGTLDDLRRETDPRRAVIAAYAQMERALARHGLPREPAEAPFEYLSRMLAELRVRPESALALTELFERARFSDHAIDAAMKDEAIEALVDVRDDLRAAA